MAAELEKTFAKCAQAGRVAFVPYMTAGYPSKECTVRHLLAMQEGGADIIELGMPFSDPLADGPTIQQSGFVALKGGVTLNDCFDFVKSARKQGLTVPVILMGYWNPFEQYGQEKLVKDGFDATLSGFIAVDLSGPEAERFGQICKEGKMAYIPLVAPTTTDKRLAEVAKFASGYVYCVSVTGITGNRDSLPEDLPEFAQRVSKATPLPIAVGFGLKTRQHVKDVGQYAQGAIMGTSIVATVRDAGPDLDAQCAALTKFIKDVTSD